MVAASLMRRAASVYLIGNTQGTLTTRSGSKIDGARNAADRTTRSGLVGSLIFTRVVICLLVVWT